jgi:MazG family protein
MGASENAESLERLDELTRRLRVECPWDREQDERSIVPHTVEEAYELADAALSGDDSRLLDELGDVLFQVHFLSLLMEERGAGSLSQVADHCTNKLIRRHPHVFGEVEVADAGEVLDNWEKIKQTEAGREPGIFGEVPENLPGTLHARKIQRRSASTGFDHGTAEDSLDALRSEVDELAEAIASGDRVRIGEEIGDVLFAAVNTARKAKVDPELELRATSNRFRSRVEQAEALAAADGLAWQDLSSGAQLGYYAQARLQQQDIDRRGR